MALHQTRNQSAEGQDVTSHRSVVSTTAHTTEDDEVFPDVDEPPDHLRYVHPVIPEFHKSAIKPQSNRKESLLTRAFQMSPIVETARPEIHISTNMARRRSSISNTSASTIDLTSDGGITSPARTDTPSPRLPATTYMNFAPYTLGPKSAQFPATVMIQQDLKEEPIVAQLPASVAIKPDPTVEALVRKRCISFACAAQIRNSPSLVTSKPISNTSTAPELNSEKAPPKKTTIKFACAGPRPSERSQSKDDPSAETVKVAPPEKSLEHIRRQNNQSPSLTRKPKPTPNPAKTQRDATTIHRRASQSPVVVRSRRPTYIAADEEALRPSEATRFHEFASDEIQEDDWIRKDMSETKQKLTINDTLKKENAIRQLGKEAEEEALQDEEEEDDDDNDNGAEDSDDSEGKENDADEEDEEETIDGSDVVDSDGNETDNEEGFADSDDESDATGDFRFWLPLRSVILTQSGEASAVRATRHRTASESSIDSLTHMRTSPRAQDNGRPIMRRRKTSRRIKILPGTPELPDSTDFVCGTLDEDRPIEDAYVSCMEARKWEKHHVIPQDIDPSFPTSDLEDQDDDEDVIAANDSDEPLWLHGKFEDDDDDYTRRRSRSIRRSPNHSPKKLHSPPPKRYHSPLPGKQRLRSPHPRRLFSHSPKRHRSPPARALRSPTASPMNGAPHLPISFAPLGQRPGLTHTKSLPRTPNAFTHQYRASRLLALDDVEGSETANGYTRGAIDIVKGLERKKQRRKEKLYQKQCNRARKGQPEKKPQPGKGAERMRELGLLMAGKLGRVENAEYMWSA